MIPRDNASACVFYFVKLLNELLWLICMDIGFVL